MAGRGRGGRGRGIHVLHSGGDTLLGAASLPPGIVIPAASPPIVAALPPTVAAVAVGPPPRAADVRGSGEAVAVAMGGLAIGGATRGRRGDQEKFELVPATRPPTLVCKEGTTGQPIKLKTNYLALTSKKIFRMMQHSVSFEPNVDHTGVRRSLVREHKETIGAGYQFDGAVLFTLNTIGNEETPLELTSTLKTDGSEVKIIIKFVKELPSSDPQTLQVYGILIRKLMKVLGLEMVGRREYYYDMQPDRMHKIPQHGVEIASGFITGVRQHEQSLLMNVHVHHKVLRTDTVLVHMRKARMECRRPDMWFEEVKGKVVGNIVITRYNNKTYRIDDIDPTKKPSSVWSEKSDETYAEYYVRRYGIIIQDMKQPLLVSCPKTKDRRSGIDGPIYLIPEVCHMTGLSDQMRADFRVMKDVAEKTRMTPQARTDGIRKLARTIRETEGCIEELKKYNLDLGVDLADVTARQLKPLPLNVSRTKNNGTQLVTRGNGDWQSEIRDVQFLRSANFNTWVLICGERDKQKAENFASTMIRAARTFGVDVRPPTIKTISNPNPASYQHVVNEAIGTFGAKLDLILAIFPDNKADRYGLFKRLTCVDNAIPSQAIVARTISNEKSVMSVASKVIQQMVCKVGGALWHVGTIPPRTMICGFDVYHDSANRNRSAGALVCSVDKFCTSFCSRVTFHTDRNELSNNLANDLLMGMEKFEANNRFLPEKIVLYRDGVGEGQIRYVVDHEVKAVEEAIKKRSPGTKLMVVVVSKKIHTQFYMPTPRGMENPPAGTVIDKVVTNPGLWDFFLIPQSVRQGTVNPVGYNVIYDGGVGLNCDAIQRLTFMLTHLYFNWSGTVRVPAPVQYAHKAALLAGDSLHRAPHPALSDKLFYL